MNRAEIIKAAEKLAEWHDRQAEFELREPNGLVSVHSGYSTIIRLLIALVPKDGMMVVPEEPTFAMLDDGHDAMLPGGMPTFEKVTQVYKAMLKAAKEEK